MFKITNPNEPTTYEKLAEEVGRVGQFNNVAMRNWPEAVTVKDGVVYVFSSMVAALMTNPDRLFWRSMNGDMWEIIWDQKAADERAANKARLAELEKKYADKS